MRGDNIQTNSRFTNCMTWLLPALVVATLVILAGIGTVAGTTIGHANHGDSIQTVNEGVNPFHDGNIMLSPLFSSVCPSGNDAPISIAEVYSSSSKIAIYSDYMSISDTSSDGLSAYADADGDGVVAFYEYDNDVLGLNVAGWLAGSASDPQVQVTDVTIIRGEFVGDWFQEIEEVDELNVGDVFIIKIEVTNKGDETEHVLSLYDWDLSPRSITDVIGTPRFCLYVIDLQPCESAILYPFCLSQAFEAEEDGGVTMNVYVDDWNSNMLCEHTFSFEIRAEEKRVHNIDTGKNFSTIQEAIDNYSTLNGHTIMIEPGTYNENVDVTKSLTIKSTSINPDDAIVKAKDPSDHVFYISADHVNISGFKVTGATEYPYPTAGIYLNGVEYCNISDNIASDNSHGVYLNYSHSNALVNNNVSNGNIGIHLYYSNGNSLTNNNATNHSGESIYLYSSNYNTLKENNVSNNYAGIILEYSSNDNVLTNNNVSNDYYGIMLWESSNNNKIYLNNFINNTDSVSSYESTNFWNSTEEITYIYNGNTYTNHLGNYWDDYVDIDVENDGIGDHSYSINDDDTDYHPLVEGFENYKLEEGFSIILKPPFTYANCVKLVNGDHSAAICNVNKISGNMTLGTGASGVWLGQEWASTIGLVGEKVYIPSDGYYRIAINATMKGKIIAWFLRVLPTSASGSEITMGTYLIPSEYDKKKDIIFFNEKIATVDIFSDSFETMVMGLASTLGIKVKQIPISMAAKGIEFDGDYESSEIVYLEEGDYTIEPYFKSISVAGAILAAEQSYVDFTEGTIYERQMFDPNPNAIEHIQINEIEIEKVSSGSIPPIAKFTPTNVAVTNSGLVKFDASDSRSYDGRTIIEYYWEFDGGDRSTCTLSTPLTPHIFWKGAGIYTVRLKVKDDGGIWSGFTTGTVVVQGVSTSSALDSTGILIECPVNTTITDQYGRIVSDNGTNEIPDADMIRMDDTKMFYLPADLTYSVDVDAYDTGTFNFARVSPIGTDISITKFENISITASTKAFVEIVPDVTNYAMSIDYDGDGVYETNVTPNETIVITLTTEITKQITTSADDGYSSPAEHYDSTANLTMVGTFGEVDFNGWYRFQNVTIPKGANITRAFVTLTAYSDIYTEIPDDTLKTVIRAEYAANPLPPSSTSDHAGRTRTPCSVEWGITEWEAGEIYSSPDISGIIQGLVNLHDYSLGAAIQIFHDATDDVPSAMYQPEAASGEGYITACTYDHSPLDAARLYIEYTVTSLRGDLNSDGILTPADAAIALQLAASGGWDANADVNRDDCITSLDALMILQAADEAITL